MKVSQRRGRLRLEFDPVEADILQELLTSLSGALREPRQNWGIVARLFPTAYPDDEEAADEFRRLTVPGLRADRESRIAACATELTAGEPIDLADPDVATRWIQVLNDLRLAIGTSLGVTEDESEFSVDDSPEDPKVIYRWLTSVQDMVVTRLMG